MAVAYIAPCNNMKNYLHVTTLYFWCYKRVYMTTRKIVLSYSIIIRAAQETTYINAKQMEIDFIYSKDKTGC